jgi:hypothetical protein
VVAVEYVVLAIIVLYTTSLATVDVTAVSITSTDGACGSSGHSYSEFTTHGGGTGHYALTINRSAASSSCTINSVSAATSGFSISDANTPLIFQAHATENLTFTVHAPDHAYNGILIIDIE